MSPVLLLMERGGGEEGRRGEERKECRKVRKRERGGSLNVYQLNFLKLQLTDRHCNVPLMTILMGLPIPRA